MGFVTSELLIAASDVLNTDIKYIKLQYYRIDIGQFVM